MRGAGYPRGPAATARAADFAEWEAAQPRVEPHGEAAYRFAGEALAEAGALVRRFPGKVVAEEIGRSVEDRPLWAFHVRDPAREPDRKLLVFANIHAMEWVPTEVAMEFLARSRSRPRRARPSP